MSLREVWTNFEAGLKETAIDFTSIDVVTLTGSITVKGQTQSLDLESLHKTLAAAAKSGGKPDAGTNVDLEVVAYTHIDFDQDAIQYIRRDTTETMKPLLDAHSELIKASQQARLSFVKMLAGLFGR